jgi:hypothetical protein
MESIKEEEVGMRMKRKGNEKMTMMKKFEPVLREKVKVASGLSEKKELGKQH